MLVKAMNEKKGEEVQAALPIEEASWTGQSRLFFQACTALGRKTRGVTGQQSRQRQGKTETALAKHPRKQGIPSQEMLLRGDLLHAFLPY